MAALNFKLQFCVLILGKKLQCYDAIENKIHGENY